MKVNKSHKPKVGRPRNRVPLARLTVVVEAPTLARLHEAASRRDQSLSAIVRHALAQELRLNDKAAA
jgi:hypothetical protein